jgi:prolyl-tRNA synthetase
MARAAVLRWLAKEPGMRMSHLFGATLREAPSGAESDSHGLLVRAGFIRQLGAGLFSSLPLAKRSLARIEALLRAEMNALGGQELSMPVVHPAEVWKSSGRWDAVGEELARFKDRRGRDMALAMTHEEVATDLCRTEVRSWRQLPMLVYQIQTKFRDDPRPRAGLIRVREFTMKDSYSFDADEQGLDAQYRAHHDAYLAFFARCGLPAIPVGSDSGMMGGSVAHEFMYLAPVGEDSIARCAGCGYLANRQVAEFRRGPAGGEPPRPLEKVATPHCTSIEELAALLKVPASRTAKAVFMVATGGPRDAPGAAGAAGGAPGAGPAPSGAPGGASAGAAPAQRFIFAVVRGDREVNETKLANAVKADALRPATEEEIRAVGAVPGYASPIGVSAEALVVADQEVSASANLVAGANEEGFHLLNVNAPRDWAPALTADIAAASDGDPCPRCGEPLSLSRGVEVGNIFKLGTRYSAAIGATFQDAEGRERPVVMGSYGIGVGRLLACVAEEHHDARGLAWPVTVAPFDVHVVSLGGPGTEAADGAERVCRALEAAGLEVLFDDREESPGVKFADADLIGVPLRVTVSARSLKAGGVELKRRDAEEKTVAPEAEAPVRVKAELGAMRAALEEAAARAREAYRLA